MVNRWQAFSAIALTAVFAVYAIALLGALLFTGSLSDSIGRRHVILAALAIQLASILMFILAVAGVAGIQLIGRSGARPHSST